MVADGGGGLLLVVGEEISTETVRRVLIGMERRVGWKVRTTGEIIQVLNFYLLLPTLSIQWCWVDWATNSWYREV